MHTPELIRQAESVKDWCSEKELIFGERDVFFLLPVDPYRVFVDESANVTLNQGLQGTPTSVRRLLTKHIAGLGYCIVRVYSDEIA